mgnify:CR=1 FL=1
MYNDQVSSDHRFVLEEVDVRVGDGDDATFERQKKKVRVYGDESALTAKYGARNEEADTAIKYGDQKPSTTGKPSISSQTFNNITKTWGVSA